MPDGNGSKEVANGDGSKGDGNGDGSKQNGGPPGQQQQGLGTFRSVFQQMSVMTTHDLMARQEHPSNSKYLTSLVAFTIVFNAFMIGLEVDTAKSDKLEHTLIFVIFEICFLAIFLAEMIIKLQLLQWGYFLDPWNILDYHLVVLGFVDIVVRFMFSGEGEMKVITAFRMLRMLRVVRQIRLLRMFRDLWTIVKGFYESLVTVFWVSVLLFVVCYAIGVLLVIAVGSVKEFKNHWPDMDIYVGSVPRAMLTVFQIITLESWSGSIVRPIMKQDVSLVVLCLIVIVLCSFGLLNVIIGVIVERTLLVAKENDQNVQNIILECEKRVMNSMRIEFMEFADASSTGELNFEQFCEAIRTKSFQSKLKIIGLPLEDAEELFFLLDVDNSQSLSVDEFIVGVQKMKGPAQGGDMIQLLAYVQRASRRALSLQAQADRLIQQADMLLERLDDMWGITEAELHERDFSRKRQKELSHKVSQRQTLIGNLEKSQQMREEAMQQPVRKKKEGGNTTGGGGDPPPPPPPPGGVV
mmetsp:Transcript_18550/g.46280  ORF Transcript_18550/g.46280 Transcript_18550/m.46280 type:complete len:524 (+) Transcript_18550:443-2014(+)